MPNHFIASLLGPLIIRTLTCGAAGLVGLGLLAGPPKMRADPPGSPSLYALLVGGGPDRESNAAQIEGHVRFVGEILPASAKRQVLFADGKADGPSVSYLDLSTVPEEKRALAVLLPANSLESRTRPPNLGARIDGPARLLDLRRAVGRLAAQAVARPAPMLLFFAGHGTQNEDREEDTQYNMWDDDALSVRDLAAELARLPLHAPTVLVMAQCYSGAFANVLFRQGDPRGELVPRELAGFFATAKDRVASGCSQQTTAADYQDFSSYFFAALCGHDRFEHPVATADFDGDGKVTLHEAFCYALIHDESVDTPICTSDVFLQRFAAVPEAEIYGRPYGEIWQAASAAQRAALDDLSKQLGLTGEQRPLAAFDRLKFSDPVARGDLVQRENNAAEQLNALRQATLQSLFKPWPGLRWSLAPDYDKALEAATRQLAQDKEVGQAVLAADKAYQDADEAVDDDEARLLRFTRLCESVVEAQQLRDHGKADLKGQLERLWQSEQRSLPIPMAAK